MQTIILATVFVLGLPFTACSPGTNHETNGGLDGSVQDSDIVQDGSLLDADMMQDGSLDAAIDSDSDGEGSDDGSRVFVDRDRFGTPYIYASSIQFSAYGLGFAMAEDHPQSLIRLYLASRGRLAEHFGYGRSGSREYITHDMQVLALRIPETSNLLYESLPDDLKEYLSMFSRGVNDYLNMHRHDPEFEWMGDFSAEPEDVFNLDRMRTVLNQFRYANEDIARFGQTECPGYVDGDQGEASNAWAISSPIAAPSKTIVASDPHLPWDLDPLDKIERTMDTRYWYEYHQKVDGFRYGGATSLGVPLSGPHYTNYIASAGSHSAVDPADAVHLQRVGANSYLYGSETREFTFREYEIMVNGRENPVRLRVRDSLFGPVICYDNSRNVDASCSLESEAFAVVLPSIDVPGFLVETWHLINARDVDDILTGLRMQLKDEGNLIFATREGDIIYTLAGRVPLREPGICYGLPLESRNPGHTFDDEGRIAIAPFEDHPTILNPSTGYVVNNNVPPQATTAGLTGLELPWHNGLFDPEASVIGGLRQQTARDVFDEAEPGSVTTDVSFALAMNTEVRTWSAFRSILQLVIERFPEVMSDAIAEEAIRALQEWDGQVRADSRAVLVFEGWVGRLDMADMPFRIPYGHPPAAEDLTESQLEAARDALVLPISEAESLCEAGVIPYLDEVALEAIPSAEGALVPWGDVHTLLLPGEPESSARPLGSGDRFLQTLLMSNASVECPDFGMGATSSGSSVMLHVTFHPDLEVGVVRPVGNISQSDDPHYGNMSDVFAEQIYREVILTEPSEEALVLTPAGS